MKIAVLIVAAGRGTRSGSEIPKQFRKIGRQTVLEKSIRCFLEIPGITAITVAIHADDKALFSAATAGVDENIEPVIGGEARTESVKIGLQSLKKNAPDLVLIHDAARPFVTQTIIQDVIDSLSEYQSCVPALPIIDAVKTMQGDPVDRSGLMRVQTPQGFRFSDIMDAYDKLDEESSFADDIEVAKNAGMTIGMSAGSEQNIKLTFASDFEHLERYNMRHVTGIGFDVHRVCDGDTLWLCGVEIDAGFSLKGHSDADVGLHALTDAVLGAISEGDIGDHFPPSDPKWKGAPSHTFLKFAADLVREHGGVIDHVDLTLICEAPKIKPHRDVMRTRIAGILDIAENQVSVKATTTEGLGFTGRREGIAAQAIANIRIPDAD